MPNQDLNKKLLPFSSNQKFLQINARILFLTTVISFVIKTNEKRLGNRGVHTHDQQKCIWHVSGKGDFSMIVI